MPGTFPIHPRPPMGLSAELEPTDWDPSRERRRIVGRGRRHGDTVSALPDGYIVLTPDGRVVRAWQRPGLPWRMASEDMLGRHLSDLATPALAETYLDHIELSRRYGRTIDLTYWWVRGKTRVDRVLHFRIRRDGMILMLITHLGIQPLAFLLAGALGWLLWDVAADMLPFLELLERVGT